MIGIERHRDRQRQTETGGVIGIERHTDRNRETDRRRECDRD